MAEQVSIEMRVDQLCGQHGGIRAAARVLKIDHAYLYRLWVGEKANPSKAVLRKLGLRKVVRYELEESHD